MRRELARTPARLAGRSCLRRRLTAIASRRCCGRAFAHVLSCQAEPRGSLLLAGRPLGTLSLPSPQSVPCSPTRRSAFAKRARPGAHAARTQPMIELDKSVWYVGCSTLEPSAASQSAAAAAAWTWDRGSSDERGALAQGSAQMVYPRSGLPSGGKDVKILLLGSKGVGKTALLVRFLTKRFIGDYDQSSDQVYKYKTTISGKHTAFHIYDTCGDCMVGGNAQDGDAAAPDESGRLEQLLKWADVVLLLFSLVEPESFVRAEKCRKRIQQQQQQQADDGGPVSALLMVGTKADLIDDRRRQTEQLIEFAGNTKLVVYQSSARESFESVLAIFQQAYREAANRGGRSPTRKLKALLQTTLRSYLARGTSNASAIEPPPPPTSLPSPAVERLSGPYLLPATAPVDSKAAAAAAGPAGGGLSSLKRGSTDGDGSSDTSEMSCNEPPGGEYRARTFTL